MANIHSGGPTVKDVPNHSEPVKNSDFHSQDGGISGLEPNGGVGRRI
jgi:hypothetical protein